jgi:hypothetical protein
MRPRESGEKNDDDKRWDKIESSQETQKKGEKTYDGGMLDEVTVTAKQSKHERTMSNPVVLNMRANSERMKSEALPFARHMMRSTIDGAGYAGAGISAVGTVVTPFAPPLGVGLLAVGGAVSTASGVASFSMNLMDGNNYAAGADLVMLGVGRYGSIGIKGLKNNYGVINTTDQVVLQSVFDTSVNIVDGFRPKK